MFPGHEELYIDHRYAHSLKPIQALASLLASPRSSVNNDARENLDADLQEPAQ